MENADEYAVPITACRYHAHWMPSLVLIARVPELLRSVQQQHDAQMQTQFYVPMATVSLSALSVQF